MRLYRTTVEAISGFTSPLHSDTLFGAFCWSYRYMYGEDALTEEVLRPSMEGCPVCIFSNAFPSGYFPMPLGIFDRERQKERQETDKRVIKENYQKEKKIKGADYVRMEWFYKIRAGETSGFREGLAKEEIHTEWQVKNSVDRDCGMVTKSEEGAHLYAVEEKFLRGDGRLDIYVYSVLEKERLLSVLSLMLELGIGGKKSVGKGRFSFCNMDKPLEECQELLELPGSNAVMMLSNMLPSRLDPMQGWYKTFVKYGKLDREYAVSDSPFKKPLLFVKSGALFQVREEERREWYGRCAAGVSAEHSDVIASGFTIAIPVFYREKSE